MKYQTLLMLVTLISTSTSMAWICDEMSSRRNGSAYEVCGRATSSTESEARMAAAKNAFAEFDEVCLHSDDCKNRKTSVEPMRTECKAVGADTTCVRMFVINLESAEKGAEVEATKTEETPKPTPQKPKMKKGLRKSEMLNQFGNPKDALDLGNNWLVVHYESSTYCRSRCTVVIQFDHVDHFDGFNVEYTDLLDEKSFWQHFKESIVVH